MISLIYVLMASIRIALRDFKGAIDDCTRAIEIKPKFAAAYNARGLVKIMLGQKDSGCMDLKKAGELGIKSANEMIKKYCQ